MRKRSKTKRHSCPLCKPHKMGGDNRWSAKDSNALEIAEREIRESTGRTPNRVDSSISIPEAENDVSGDSGS